MTPAGTGRAELRVSGGLDKKNARPPDKIATSAKRRLRNAGHAVPVSIGADCTFPIALNIDQPAIFPCTGWLEIYEPCKGLDFSASSLRECAGRFATASEPEGALSSMECFRMGRDGRLSFVLLTVDPETPALAEL